MTGHQEHEDEYTDEFVQTLELIWGEGFLSPGGADEVAMALDGVDIALVRKHRAASVHGIDIEQPLIDSAVARAAREGLSDHITYQKVTPGRFPFADAKNAALRATAGDDADHYVNLWNAGWQTAVVGQLAPGHLRGFKPDG